MRELTVQEIEELACRPNCNKKAITSYLNELKNETSPQMFGVIANARTVANQSGWNRATSDAIVEGIRLAYGK